MFSSETNKSIHFWKAYRSGIYMVLFSNQIIQGVLEYIGWNIKKSKIIITHCKVISILHEDRDNIQQQRTWF